MLQNQQSGFVLIKKSKFKIFFLLNMYFEIPFPFKSEVLFRSYFIREWKEFLLCKQNLH